MLDRKFIVENSEAVKRNCRDRGVAADVDRFLALEGLRRERQAEVENLNRRANEVSKSIGQAKDATEREARKEEGRQLRERTGQLRAELDALAAEQEAIHRWIPNMSHPMPSAAATTRRTRLAAARPRCWSRFPSRLTTELAERLDLIDFAGAPVAATVLLQERGAAELALRCHGVADWRRLHADDHARRPRTRLDAPLYPRGPETQIYSIENQNLSLIATAEITLGGLLAGQTVDAEALPLKLCGVSHCFRTEAGAHGKESRGLFRVHQFTKVEMFAFTLPDDSEAMLEYLRELECRLFDGLAIPYRVVDTATGDLGGPAYRKYDLEAWLPGRASCATSTSNCTDYQAWRLNARFGSRAKKARGSFTLNGTAIAIAGP